MERIGRHISELLFDHDCVIVPSLGGFLASNEHARMLPNRVIYPPYRRLAFNVYLKQNDGLLANHLVESENITYASANSLLEEFTYECIQNLEQGKKINIEEVGTLYFDHEKNIQFEAYRNINHRIDSFGMEPVHIITVQRESQQERKITAKKPVKPIRPSVPGKRIIISKKGKSYIGVVAALAAIVWFSASLYLVIPKKYEATSLNPFDSQVSVASIEPDIDSDPSIVTVIQPDTDTGNQPDTDAQAVTGGETLVAENVTVVPETVSTAIVPIPDKPVTEVPSSNQIEDSSIRKNYVIAGVFAIRENALNMVTKLRSAGFKNARMIEANNRSYVSYQEYLSAEEAVAMIDSLRKNSMEGWVWKH